jgi:NADH:ubiquinone oxidoreductase subunit C
MIENLLETTIGQLSSEVQKMQYEGYRFVTATCVDNGDGFFDVFYHFDINLKLKNLRIKVQKDSEVPSISRIFFCALFVENEMKELFGLNVTNIAIDYGGHMLLSDGAPGTPMARRQITIVKKGEEKNA